MAGGDGLLIDNGQFVGIASRMSWMPSAQEIEAASERLAWTVM